MVATMPRSQRKCGMLDMKLRTGFALLALARCHNSFILSPAFRPSAPAAAAVSSSFQPGIDGPVSRWAPAERRRAELVAPFMAAGEGMGGGLSGAKGAGGRGGKGKKKKKKKKGSKQGTLIAGPPRLETVPEDKLDQAYIFRQERLGQ